MIVNDTEMDRIFRSLADRTRRDILHRLVSTELSVSEIAAPYDLTYAAISKHLKVLENARLVSRRRDGKRYLLQANLDPLREVDGWINFYRRFWSEAFDKLGDYLAIVQENKEDE